MDNLNEQTIKSILDKLIYSIDNIDIKYIKSNKNITFLLHNFFYNINHGLYNSIINLIINQYLYIDNILNDKEFSLILLLNFIDKNKYNLTFENYFSFFKNLDNKNIYNLIYNNLYINIYLKNKNDINDLYEEILQFYKYYITNLEYEFLNVYKNKISSSEVGKKFKILNNKIQEKMYKINTFIKLPIFYSLEELKENKQWYKYLLNIYSIENIIFPLDLREFNCFYNKNLPDELKKLKIIQHSTNAPNLYDCLYSIKFINNNFLFFNVYGYIDNNIPNCFMLAYPNGFPNNSIVEVHHEYGDPSGCGYWMFYAPGSGMSCNIGKTICFKTHKEAHKYFGYWDDKYNCWDTYMFKNMIKYCKLNNYDTIQFSDHKISGGKISVFEIVDVNQGIQLKSGLPNPSTNFLFNAPVYRKFF